MKRHQPTIKLTDMELAWFTAVSGEFHSNKRFKKFYKRKVEEGSGSVNIWETLAVTIRQIVEADRRLNIAWSVCDFILTVEAVTDILFKEEWTSINWEKELTKIVSAQMFK